MRSVLILLTLALLTSTGCTTSVQFDNGARLIARPDFPAAKAAAPEWCRDALDTIAALEYELEKQ